MLKRTAVYLPSGPRKLFTLLSLPEGSAKGVVVHVPAFAEEMNKSRRMVTLATEGLVADGWAVVVFDFSGCGDSSEMLEHVDWEMWVEDLDTVFNWVGVTFPGLAVNLWCLRGGALIASDWLGRAQRLSGALLLWQPVLSGKLQLTQFLRLKAANGMSSDADARRVMADVRTALSEGKSVDVAGYRLSAKLAEGMNGAAFSVGENGPLKLAVLEVGGNEDGALSPAVQTAVSKWARDDRVILCEKVAGPTFWGTPYIRTVPALVLATRRMLRQWQE